MKIGIAEIKSFLEREGLEHEYYGDASLSIIGFCPISEIAADSVTWIKRVDGFDLLKIGDPSNLLIIVDKLPDDYNISGYNLIVSDYPKMLYFEIISEFFKPPQKPRGIAASSIVETENIGANISIGHNCYICGDVTLGNNVTIKNNVVIECQATIGDDCCIGSGTVIGTAGYGYYASNDGRPKKVPDFGGVIIGNRVDIGANTCIARGTLANTVIEDDVKIDNLCHIAHNVHIGARSYVIALSLLGGSCKLEEDVYVAPGALVMNQLTVGKNALVGMGAVVTQNVVENKVVAGVPAKVLRDNSHL